MSFKIIAVRPLPNCAKNILKNLKSGQFYFFDNTYEYNFELGEIKKKDGELNLPSNFFSLLPEKRNKLSSLESININAIVGKNGSGKSSLVELVIRILNNFFKNQQYIKLTDRLHYSKGVAAELYFSVDDDTIYKIHVDTTKVGYGKNYKYKEINIRPQIQNISHELFFTMYVNYSLYGLDSYEFLEETIPEKDEINSEEKEDESWLDRVFHKNDGYQTQLVIHPWREGGQIDIRKEKELMRQRLISQIILDSTYKDFTESQEIEAFQFTYNTRNYLKEYFNWISDFEKNVHKDEFGDDNYFNWMELYISTNSTKAQMDFHGEIKSFVEIMINNNISKRVHEQRLKFRKENEQDFMWSTGPFINYTYLTNNQLKEIIMLSICFEIVENEVGKFSDLKNDPFLENLFFYSLVKLRKTIRYPRYQHLNLTYSDFESLDTNFKEHREDISNIIKDDSHISIKLRQALEILKLAKDSPKNPLIVFYKGLADKLDSKTQDVTELRRNIKSAVKRRNLEPIYFVPPPVFYVDILLKSKATREGENNTSTNKQDNSWKSISSGEFQKIGIISSLVYHLNNLDSVVSDRNFEGDFYNYENINIILDEIDLYFHPEYQRTFIYDLISRLEKISFKQIKNINFTFITHSPFILSDIPSQNILKLNDGMVDTNNTVNSFAANIHDLLRDDFFLKGGAMGEFAAKKIDGLVRYLYLKSKIVDLENDMNIDFYSKQIKADMQSVLEKCKSEIQALEMKNTEVGLIDIISLIGEPILKSKLLELYNKVRK